MIFQATNLKVNYILAKHKHVILNEQPKVNVNETQAGYSKSTTSK